MERRKQSAKQPFIPAIRLKLMAFLTHFFTTAEDDLFFCPIVGYIGSTLVNLSA